MKSRARGLYQTEALINIAERLVAALQDAGANHVRDVAIYFTAADAAGREVMFIRSDCEIDELKLDFGDLAQSVPEPKLTVVRPDNRQPTYRTQHPTRRQKRDL